MPRKTAKPRIGIFKLPERNAHAGVAFSDDALRELLGAPADLPLVQWQIGPLDGWHEKLSGCFWHIVGPLVPPTPRHISPGYPYIQHSLPQPTRLQAWLWRVYKLPPPPYPRPLPFGWNRPFGDLRWRPDRGVWMTMELLASDGPEVARCLWEWIHVSQLVSSGRPRHKGTYTSAEEFLHGSSEVQGVLPAIQRVRAYKHADPTQKEVMEEMAWDGDTSRLREQCRKWGYPWQRLLCMV